jgi:hypothetical protein
VNKPLKNAIGDLIATAEAEQLTVARYRAALELLSQGHVFDAPAFAGAVLAGQDVQRAHVADVVALSLPNEAEDQVAIEAGLKRHLARRELVKAALAWYEATTPDVWAADVALQKACKAFRAAGGSEVTG